MIYSIRRNGSSPRYSGERIFSGTLKQCLEYLKPILAKRLTSGWTYGRIKRAVVFEHEERQEVIQYEIERAA